MHYPDHEEIIRQTQTEDALPNTGPVLFKTLVSQKTKSENYSKLKENKQTWQPNKRKYDPELDLRFEKEIALKDSNK